MPPPASLLLLYSWIFIENGLKILGKMHDVAEFIDDEG